MLNLHEIKMWYDLLKSKEVKITPFIFRIIKVMKKNNCRHHSSWYDLLPCVFKMRVNIVEVKLKSHQRRLIAKKMLFSQKMIDAAAELQSKTRLIHKGLAQNKEIVL